MTSAAVERPSYGISGPVAPQASSLSYSLGTLMLVMTLIAVVCGMLAVAPGLGVVVAIASLPVLIRTVGVVRKREEAGLPTPPAKKAFLFVTSLGATLVTVTVLCVASVGTFCAVCLGLASATSGRSIDEGPVIAFSVLIAAAATIGVIVLAVKEGKARWRRDTQKP